MGERRGQAIRQRTRQSEVLPFRHVETKRRDLLAIFDEQTKPFFWVSGTGWGDFGTIQRLIFDNRELVETASSIKGLADETGLSDGTLLESVRRYNELVDKGDDTDFGRFGPSSRQYAGQMISTLTPPRGSSRLPSMLFDSSRSHGRVTAGSRLICRARWWIWPTGRFQGSTPSGSSREWRA